MRHPLPLALATLLAAATLALAAACAGGLSRADGGGGGPTTIASQGSNVVATWDEIANATATMPPSPAGATPEERRPGPDIATVHLAIYDAVISIDGGRRPFAARPTTPVSGASQDAAATEAAYRVLKGLFPSRSEKYQAAYDSGMAAIPAGDAKSRGIAIGAEAAAAILALRANDGRIVELPPYAAGTRAGDFRGANPINRHLPSIRPFTLREPAQFRPAGPSPRASSRYAQDWAEVASLGASASTTRSAAQLEVARFHTERPDLFWARNLHRFSTSQATLADNARLMAVLWVSFQDAVDACFEAKYRYNAWRPLTAIPQADPGENPATRPDPAWTPVLPTPNHPEYPAAHGCASGAVAESLRLFFGTTRVAFDMDSTASGTTHHFDSTTAFLAELANARVWGGMHFRQSLEDGQALGRDVARWVAPRFGVQARDQ